MAEGFEIVISRDDIDTDLYDVPVLVNLGSASGISAFDTTAVFDNLTDPTKLKFLYKKFLPSLNALTHNEVAENLGAVSAWDFDETSGNTAYDSVGSKDIVFGTTPVWSKDALHEGPNEGTSVGLTPDSEGYVSSGITGAGTYSLAFKALCSDYSSSERSGLLGSGANNNTFGFDSGTGRIEFYNGSYNLMTHAVPVNNVPIHIVFVRDNTAKTYVVYADGVKGTVANIVSPMYSSYYLSSHFTGDLDGFALFNKALTDSEALELAEASSPPEPDDLDVSQQWCNAEVDRWDQSGEQAQIWIRVPYISKDVDTVIQLQYNLAQSVNTEYVDYPGNGAAKVVWEDYAAVYHLSSDGTDSGADSVDGTLINTPSIIDFGKGKGLSFNGTTQRIDIPSTDLGFTYTISMIIELADVIGAKAIIDGLNGGWYLNGDKVSWNTTSDSTTALSASTTYHIVVSSNGDVYINGVFSDTISPAAVTLVIDTIASETSVPANWFAGKIKELRFASEVKTAAYHSVDNESILDTLVTYTQSTDLNTIITELVPIGGIELLGQLSGIDHETAEVWTSLPGLIGISGIPASTFMGKIAIPNPSLIHLTMGLANVPSWFFESIVETPTFTSSSSIDRFQIFKILENLTIQQTDLVQHLGSYSVTESFTATDLIELYIVFIITEVSSITDTPLVSASVNKLAKEIINTLDITENQIIAKHLILDAISILDNLQLNAAFIVTETMSVLDNIEVLVKTIFNIVEALKVLEVSSPSFVAVVFTKDIYDINNTVSSKAIFSNIISENINTFGTIAIDDKNYTFVINTETKGISEYNNYNFNSMSENLGATSTGIYSLIGDNDAGVPIDALIKTGLMDFGNSREKQVPYAYIGLNKEGEMLLKTIVDYKGTRKERWYAVNPKAVSSTDTVRIKMGKGVKSRFWQFELSNKNGQDFELDSIEMIALTLKRRI